MLVVSSVHPPDDPRIRAKLVETLAPVAAVRYATTAPGPVAADGIEIVALEGRRLRRSLTASWLILRGGYDVASVHDPELLPAAVLAGLLRRHVVFDLHENLPATMGQKRRIPKPLRGVATWVVTGLLRLADRLLPITLAEESYRSLFAREHPVFPNFLAIGDVPITDPAERSGVVYLGDVTEERGLLDAGRRRRQEPGPPAHSDRQGRRPGPGLDLGDGVAARCRGDLHRVPPARRGPAADGPARRRPVPTPRPPQLP